MRRIGLIGALYLGLLATPAVAQEGRTPDPRAGETVLLCADGGWDVATGTCRGRGGVVGQYQYGSGIRNDPQSSYSVVLQPSAISAAWDAAEGPPPGPGAGRSRWTDPIGGR